MSSKAIDQQVAAHFNKRGGEYSLAWVSQSKKYLNSLELNFIHSILARASGGSKSKPLKTLDIGIGNGRISELILQNNVEHYAIDVSQKMVEFCQKKFKQNRKIKNIIVHDIVNPLPKGWNGFMFITAIRVLSYTPQWRTAFQNIYGVMKPGAVFTFTFPNKYSSTFLSYLLPRKGLEIGKHALSYPELKEVLTETGFREVEITGFNKLWDILYDWSDNNLSANLLLGIEKLLRVLLGPTLFTREFYITCKK